MTRLDLAGELHCLALRLRTFHMALAYCLGPHFPFQRERDDFEALELESGAIREALEALAAAATPREKTADDEDLDDGGGVLQ